MLLTACAATPKPPVLLEEAPPAYVPAVGVDAKVGDLVANIQVRQQVLTRLGSLADKAPAAIRNRLKQACDSAQVNTVTMATATTAADVHAASVDAAAALGRCAQTWRAAVVLGLVADAGITEEVARIDPSATSLPPSQATGGVSFEAEAIASIADFVVSRAKAEVLNWVANDVATKLCSVAVGDAKDIASYVPQTCALLKDSNGTISGDLSKFGRTLQVALQSDASDLVERLVVLARDWKPAAVAVYQIIVGVRHGQDPLVLIRAASEQLVCDPNSSATQNTTHCTLRLIAMAVDVVVHQPGWNDLDLSRRADVEAFLLAAGQDMVKAVNANAALSTWLQKRLPTFGSYNDLLAAVLTAAKRIDVVITKARSETDAEKRKALAAELLTATLALADGAVAIVMNHADTTIASDLDTFKRLLRAFHEARAALDARDLGMFVAALTRAASVMDIKLDVPDRVRHLVPFLAAFASATSADEMRAALEKYAAPQGGYKEKQTRSMGSLTAFVGVAAGGEGFATGDTHTRAHVGLFAPIGLDVSCGGASACAGWGLFVSALDVGNVVSLGFGDGTRDPDPRLRQVLSPGLYVRRHFDALGPVAVGAGAAVIPELGQATSGDTGLTAGFKFVLFIAADVTIFPF